MNRLCLPLTHWRIVPDIVAHALARIEASARTALQERGAFHLVLAGGNTPREMYRRLPELDTDWSRWHIWYGDERCLPVDDPERNSRMAGAAWLDASPIPRVQIHDIPAELGAAAATHSYATTINNQGAFDLVLLGLGEDGHTASLFPGHVDAETASEVVAIFNAPKPPSERVSLSVNRLSRTHAVLFLIAGAAKRAAVQAWRCGEALPAALICPDSRVEVLLTPEVLG